MKDILGNLVNDVFTLRKISECDTNFISNNPSLLTSSFFGGPILKRLNSTSNVFQYYSNAGQQIGISITYRNSINIHTIYVFPDCSIGFLHNDSSFTIIKPSGNIEAQFKSYDDVLYASCNYLGITYLTKKGVIVFINAFTKVQDIIIHNDNQIIPIMAALYSLKTKSFIIIGDDNNVYLRSEESLRYITNLTDKPSNLMVPIDGNIGIADVNNLGIVFPINEFAKDCLPFIAIDGYKCAGWCKEYYILFSKSEITVFSDGNNIKNMQIPEIKYVISDCNSIRVLTSIGLFLMVPPNDQVSRFTMSPNKDAYNGLINAYLSFENKSVDCIQQLNGIDLEQVSDDLLSVCPFIFDINEQRLILSSCAFAREFSNTSRTNSSVFSDTVKKTKFINSMRCERKISIITAPNDVESVEEFVGDFFTFSIDRLCSLNLFNEAAKLSEYYGFSESYVSEKWAVEYISMRGQDHIGAVVERLKKVPNVNFKEIADQCLQRNFISSAVTFANNLRCVKERVQFLLPLSLKDSVAAACSTLDGSAIVSVWKKTGEDLPEMHDTILFCEWMNTRKSLTYNEFATYVYVFFEQALRRTMKYGLETNVVDSAISYIPENDIPFKSACHGQNSLSIILQRSKRQEESSGRLVFTKSPRQYMKEAAVNGDEETFKKIKEKFKFTDAQASFIRLQALATSLMWPEFDAATRMEPACGWVCTCEILMNAGNSQKAMMVLKMAPSSREKLALCDRLKMWADARKICEDLKLSELAEKYRNMEMGMN